MHVLFWIGLVVLALCMLASSVVDAAIWFAISLSIVGLGLMIWRVDTMKRTI